MTTLQFIELVNPRTKNLTGLRFGRLDVLGPVGRSASGKVVWACQCECGEIASVTGEHLRRGHTNSCGCLNRDTAAENMGRVSRTHGLSHTALHKTWMSMKARCCDPNNPSFEHYGGRGISVYAGWMDDFKSFYDHASSLPHYGEAGRTLDRIDNDRGYEPGNVQWGTAEMQRRNQRRNRKITIDGRTLTISEWADVMGIRMRTITYRLNSGWSERDAVMEPSQRAEFASMAQAAIETAVR